MRPEKRTRTDSGAQVAVPLQAFLTRYVPSLEKTMRAVVRTEDKAHSEFFGLLQYHLGWVDATFKPLQAPAGKRVRPVLCLLVCEACGGDWKQALPAAAAIELVHNFSLIHDDIEDQDKVRRSRPTLWVLWGEPLAINAGDGMFSLAQIAMLRLNERGVGAGTMLEACRLLNHTCLALTGGQHLDISFERRTDVTTADHLRMIEGKTAAVVACACELGALIATHDDASISTRSTQRERVRSFGHHLGLAFQIRDDILGIWGDPVTTGKPAGADIIQRKKSLPILHGLAQSAVLRELLAQATLSPADVRHATALLRDLGSREFARQMAQKCHDLSLASLEEADLRGPAAEALLELAQTLLNRDH